MSLTLTKAAPASRLRPAFRATAIIITIALAGAAPAIAAKKKAPVNRGLESVNQPVVHRTDFVFDAIPDGYNGLSRDERQRLLDWFDAIELGYGDRVAIAGDGDYTNARLSSAVSDLVGRYGLLMADAAPRTVGDAPSGAVRIVVSRSTASVPTCPNWGNRFEADLQGGLSTEYGCAINGNLAGMIANPEDLVQGRQNQSRFRGATASRAVNAFRNAAPSGGGGSNLK
ncbi:CpaD family pilus assembly protein [Sphingobium sufflavum]|uniref:CpaD family pilus assembly lipoprotein n=1 Tax=Sphingobium sufflavum TaxID=1129547 RepID=UPI001F2952C7|nr:CpaD family pilus assembly lipoprotein [Sphingobium sufflavum]MCE7795848.1 CpaD family pilus assembly protein [Sphingobium sufflavum]